MGRALAGVPHRVMPPIAPLALSGPTPGPFFWRLALLCGATATGRALPGVPHRVVPQVLASAILG